MDGLRVDCDAKTFLCPETTGMAATWGAPAFLDKDGFVEDFKIPVVLYRWVDGVFEVRE
jgi:hypothetical protein